jgi:hypothetical protein
MKTARLVLGLLLLGGCSAKLSGEFMVDGKAWKPDSCRSGQVYGFAGVELAAADGSRLRFSMLPSGAADVFHLPAGASQGAGLSDCATMTIAPQNSTINDIRNVEGKVTADCNVDGKSIKGSVDFGNCH